MERTGEVVPVADPGFPRGAPPEREGAPTYYLAKICRRVHANEENWTGGRRLKFYYLDPSLGRAGVLASVCQ